ncbi:MAG: HRDC domain-containing protein, partial [Gemmatimonadota bacterium]|nr:HRDC domain-containing protein [Gemmatimonadota bacterium]
MEAVARRNPATVDELLEVTELRRWQAGELGEAFVKALEPHRKGSTGKKPPRAPRAKRAAADDGSPYKE